MKFYLFCVALFFLGAESSILPKRIRENVCKKSDPNYQTCFRQSMEIVRSDFMKGIPEVGFAGIDPLTTEFTQLGRTMGLGTAVKVTMKNSSVSGLSNAIIEDLRADPNTLFGQIRFFLPSVVVSSEVDASGSVLWVPINISGDVLGSYSSLRIEMNFQFYKYQNNGQWYFGFDSDKSETWFEVGPGTMYVTAADENLQGAADVFSDWFNDNQEGIIQAINPLLQDILKDFIGKHIEDYISKIPADELLPE